MLNLSTFLSFPFIASLVVIVVVVDPVLPSMHKHRRRHHGARAHPLLLNGGHKGAHGWTQTPAARNKE